MNDDLKTQLTAWALDELPPDERTGLEARLSDSPEARTYAEETRQFCTLLTQTLAPNTETTLTPDQRAGLARQFQTPAPAGKVVRFHPASLAWVAGLAAAAAALVLWSGGLFSPTPDTVAMQHATNAPEGALFGDTHRSSGDRSGLVDELSRVEDKPEGLSLPGNESLEEKVSKDTNAFSLAQNTASQPQETLRTRSFGINPAQPGSKPDGAQGLEGDVALGGIALQKSKSTTWSAQFGNEANLALEPAEPTVDGSAASPRSLAAVAAAVAAAAPTSSPSDPAGSSPRRAKLAGLADLEAGLVAGDALHTATTDGEATRLSSINRGLARPDIMASFDTDGSKALGLARQVQDTGVGPVAAGGPIAGTSTRGGEAEKLTAGGAGLDAKALAESAPPAALFSEDAFNKEARNRETYHFRYVTPTPPESTAESYAAVPENPFKAVAAEPLSTFSIDVDTAAYANVRRFLNQGQRPPQPAVRIEEMVNYFRYDYPQPEAGKPFSVVVDLADCPWQPQHRLARVGLKGREIAADKRPQSNLVFLIDVSGSMDEPNKLPLVQQSLRMLSGQLGEKDRVAMVTYAGNSGLALESTTGTDRAKIGSAIDRLSAGGSTNGASGIQLAYEVAQQNFVKEGVNRVLLATDGDFNVGVTSQEALQTLITDRAKGGVFLSVLGYGMGNLKDSTMEMLADKGNGNYAYIDSLSEARKVLSEEMSGTLVTIAKDVKVQIEFNPAIVRGYRLLGYENRMLAREDFNNDKKDAGEIGAGHTVTALYELVPVGAPTEVPPVDGLKYAPPPEVATAAPAELRKPIDPAIARETMTVKLRYKAPDGETSQLLEVPVVDKEAKFAEAPADFKFAASVTMFAMLLKDSAHKGNANWDQVRQFALQGKGPDPLGYRGEFIQLVEKARGIAP